MGRFLLLGIVIEVFWQKDLDRWGFLSRLGASREIVVCQARLF